MSRNNCRQLTFALAAGAMIAASAVSLAAQTTATPATMKEDKPGQLALAKVAPAEARKIALARVPKGAIEEEGIEKEDGKLVYSFDIKVPGKSGIEEVLVDAMSGKVVSQEHESPKQQADERRKDAAEKKAAAAKGAKTPPR